MSVQLRRFSGLAGTLLLVLFACTCARAQIRITRQVVAAAVFSATPDGNDQRLKMTATAGEVFVGTRRGDVRATVGFQQPDDDVLVAVVELPGRSVTVRSYPNPATERLYVDLTAAADLFGEVLLLDLYGRPLIRRRVDAPIITITAIAELPGGTYFLRGTDREGRAYSLGTVLVTPH